MEPFPFESSNPLLNPPTEQQERRYKRRPRDPDKAARYAAQTPELNYSEFGKKKAQYVDLTGREYILATGKVTKGYVRSGDIKHPYFVEPDRELQETLGTQVFWIRIPIHLRGTVPFPEPEGENLQLYFARDQILCRGRTDGVFVSGPRKKTGFVVVRDFQTFGQVADPSKYEHLVVKEQQVKRNRTLF